MIADVQLTLRGSVDSLRIAWQTGETLLEPVRFEEDPESTRYNILVAVQEMLTNVIRYGNHGAADQPVQVGFSKPGSWATAKPLPNRYQCTTIALPLHTRWNPAFPPPFQRLGSSAQ